MKMGKESQLPWLCIGDFNEISSIWEKQGGAEVSSSRIEKFQAMISDCALMDLEFKGNAFTWSNNQSREANIRERIDRALANVEWRRLFPCAQVLHEVVLGSDHCPLVLNLNLPLKRIPKLFKFESRWTTYQDCENIIKAAWGRAGAGSQMFRLVQNLKLCRKALLDWSKKAFGNSKRKLESLKTQLSFIQAQDPDMDLVLQQRKSKVRLKFYS